MTVFSWILKSVVETTHDLQILEHGGLAGVRDQGLLESALARPVNLNAYGVTDPFALAAAYASGIVRNHPFVDGNKRTAFLTAYIFLRLNGYALHAKEADAVAVVLSLTSCAITEEDFAAWLRRNAQNL